MTDTDIKAWPGGYWKRPFPLMTRRRWQQGR
jgi:hypothetical protein